MSAYARGYQAGYRAGRRDTMLTAPPGPARWLMVALELLSATLNRILQRGLP